MATLVRFIGGPFAGQAEASSASNADPLRGSGALMAEMAYHDYLAHPPAPGAARWMFCRVYEGKTAGPHFYKIVSGETKAGRLELVCEYGGKQCPAD